jgi:hypothetical protein
MVAVSAWAGRAVTEISPDPTAAARVAMAAQVAIIRLRRGEGWVAWRRGMAVLQSSAEVARK